MSKQVTITAYCDGTHDSPVRATVERTVRLDEDEPKQVDVCEEHDVLFQQVAAFIEVGLPVRRGHGKTKPVVPRADDRNRGAQPDQQLPCPEPGCTDPVTGLHRTCKNRAGLAQHVRQAHDKALSEYPSATSAA